MKGIRIAIAALSVAVFLAPMVWAGSSPDREKVAAIHEEISTLRQRLNQLAVQYQMDCREVLTPDQQAKLAETATERHRTGVKKHP